MIIVRVYIHIFLRAVLYNISAVKQQDSSLISKLAYYRWFTASNGYGVVFTGSKTKGHDITQLL